MALIFGFGAVWEGILIWYYGSWEGNIFLTFSLSVLLIYLWQWIKKQWCIRAWYVTGVLLFLYAGVLVGTFFLVKYVHVEYGIFGVLSAVAVACFDYDDGKAPRFMRCADHLPVKLLMLAAMLVLLAWPSLGKTVQIYALLAIIPLAFYNGTAGNRRLKYAFYIFYPVHLVIIGLIREWR